MCVGQKFGFKTYERDVMKKMLCMGLAIVLVGIFSMGAYAADSGLKAKIISIKGDVKVDPKGSGSWLAAEVDMELNQGAIIKTGAGSSANLAFDTAMLNVLNIEENTTLSVDILSEALSRVGLSNGNILAKLEGLKKGSTFQVKTPTAICGARGTVWAMQVSPRGTTVQALAASIFLQGMLANGEASSVVVEVPAGSKSEVKAGENPTSPVALSTSELKALSAQVAAVTETVAAVAATAAEAEAETTETETTTETEQEAQMQSQQQVKLQGSPYN